MSLKYNQYYQTENLFGDPYPELIHFFATYPQKGKVLDLGCGQGRDAISIARLGYEVVGMDNSRVGIEQMIQIAERENLPLTGLVSNMYEMDDFTGFDFILLDSMFHFLKADLDKETGLIKKIMVGIDEGSHVIFCIQDSGKKVQILNEILNVDNIYSKLLDQSIEYLFEDKKTGHKSKSKYRLIIVRK